MILGMYCMLKILSLLWLKIIRSAIFMKQVAFSLLIIISANLFAEELSNIDKVTTVPKLIQTAFSYHPTLRSQTKLSEAARAGITGAKWQFWATPSIGVERANTNDPSYSGDNTVTTLRLEQPLWSGGKLSGNLSKAEAKAISAQADIEITRQQLALRIIQAWIDASVADSKYKAYDKSRSLHARLLGLVERRTQEGVSAQADIDLARSRIDAIDSDLASTRVQRDIALDKLRLLSGESISIAQMDNMNSDAVLFPVLSLDELLAAARKQSPQIGKARAQSKMAESDISIARSALSPGVYLRAERQYGNFTTPDASPQNRVFIGMSTAFGGGLSSLSGIDAALAQYSSALEDIQTQQLSIDEQVQSDVFMVQTAELRLRNLEHARQSASDVSASWERQFLAGRKQWQDLMNATREETQTEIQIADTLGAQQLSKWRLLVLSQGVDAVLQLVNNIKSTDQK